MAIDSNVYVTQIPDLVFFQGDTVTIPFVFVDGDDEPIDLRKVDVFWYCCPYGRYQTPALTLSDKMEDEDGNKKIVIPESRPNVCYVNLTHEDTKNLNFIKYSHQPVLVLQNSYGTRKYVRAEGNIIFKPQIQSSIEINLRR